MVWSGLRYSDLQRTIWKSISYNFAELRGHLLAHENLYERTAVWTVSLQVFFRVVTTIGYSFSCNLKTVSEHRRNFWMMKISFYRSLMHSGWCTRFVQCLTLLHFYGSANHWPFHGGRTPPLVQFTHRHTRSIV